MAQAPDTLLFLHTRGSDVLDATAPTATTTQFKDAASVNFANGNPWKDIGTWSAAPGLTAGTVTALSTVHVWLGLKNSDDQGTSFDLRAEVYKNAMLVATGQTLCITGVTRNPDNAREVTLAFPSITAIPFNGTTDGLALKIRTRIGTNPNGTKCSGHSNAVGLRLYYDATARPARFGTTVRAEGNRPPVANAGPDQTALVVGQMVTLDGSQSTDADGDPLQYDWSLMVPTGSHTALADSTAIHPTFVVDLPGTYTAQLIVRDGTVDSAPDTVTITMLNSRPVANAGPDQAVVVGDTVHLTGSKSSDVDGDLLTYHWSVFSAPVGSHATLLNPQSVTPDFVVDLPGTYVMQLIVRDGTVDSAPDTVTITTLNSRPVANAGPDWTVVVGSTVTLDGSASHDADGDSLRYHWSLSAVPVGSTASLSDPSAVHPSFLVDHPGPYVAQLIVDDNVLDSLPDTVTISTENSRPVANAGPDQPVSVGATVHLDGRASSDADGDLVHYRWAFVSMPTDSTATLTDADTAQPSFVVDRVGTYVVQLIVDDNVLDSAPDTVAIVASIVDTQPPDLRIDPPDGALRNTASVLLTITYSDDAAGVVLSSLQVQLDSVDATALFAATATATSATYRATLADGPHRLAASLQDRAGNAAQATSQFTIDIVPPAAGESGAPDLGARHERPGHGHRRDGQCRVERPRAPHQCPHWPDGHRHRHRHWRLHSDAPGPE